MPKAATKKPASSAALSEVLLHKHGAVQFLRLITATAREIRTHACHRGDAELCRVTKSSLTQMSDDDPEDGCDGGRLVPLYGGSHHLYVSVGNTGSLWLSRSEECSFFFFFPVNVLSVVKKNSTPQKKTKKKQQNCPLAIFIGQTRPLQTTGP